MEKTIKLYDLDSHLKSCQALVLGCDYIEDRQCYGVYLNQTVFFPEGGGQFADTGFIEQIEVFDVQLEGDAVVHYTREPVPAGMEVTCKISWERRFDFMQQHSAEHIVSGLVYQKYGYSNVGFHLGLTETTLDFDGPLNAAQLKELEILANKAVYKNIPFDITFPDADALAAMSYRSKKELSGEVRIVTLPGYDVCACCAPHVYASGEIGCIKIVDAFAHRGGMRLTILCGSRALADYCEKQQSVLAVSNLLSAKQHLVAEAVEKCKKEQAASIRRINDLQAMVLEASLKTLPAPSEVTDVCLFQQDLDTKAIRNAVNTLCADYTGYCGIFSGNDETGYTFVLGSATKDCTLISGLFKAHFGAKSGGSAKMIQGSIAAAQSEIRAVLAGV